MRSVPLPNQPQSYQPQLNNKHQNHSNVYALRFIKKYSDFAKGLKITQSTDSGFLMMSTVWRMSLKAFFGRWYPDVCCVFMESGYKCV